MVGDEALAALAESFLDDRMTCGDDEKFTAGVELGPDVAAVGREFGERGKHVELRDGRRCFAQRRRFPGDARAQIDEKLPLNFEDALIGSEYFALVFLQLCTSEALGVDEGLLALVVAGREMQVRLGDLDVVAENLVEADFERSDVGALALALFHRGDDLLAVLAEIAQLVEVGVET